MPLKKPDADAEYIQWLTELKQKIRNSQLRAGLKVNTELLALYWELGRAMSDKQANSSWGDKIITQLAKDLTAEFKDQQGFSRSNLFNIRKWYQFYSNDPQLVQQAVGLIALPEESGHDQAVQQPVGLFPAVLGFVPWGHHIQIFTKSKSIEEALYYIQQTGINNWKRTVLVYHMESGLFQRKGKSLNNFDITLPKPQSELASEILKNPYQFSFLNLAEEASERDLENAILANLKKFLLEMGVGFSFLGQQYHLKVGEKDFYLDLLFYHTRLHCYFVVELKVTDFEPEFAGKLEFYITAVDEHLKQPEDNPTIGLLLCKSADKIVVEYSLRNKNKPMSVSEYKHTIPTEWRNELPNEDQLKMELEKEIVTPQKPVQQKIERLKEIVQNLNTEPADIEKDHVITKRVFVEILQPLAQLIDEKLTEIKPLFKRSKIEGRFNQQQINGPLTEYDIDASLLSRENIWLLGFEVSLDTFIPAGTKAFNIYQKLEIHLDNHKFSIGPDRSKVWIERVYRRMLTQDELEEIADKFIEMTVEETNKLAEGL